ncbi:hypothetical protein K438DRAFT_1196123 [Mycena galopus ATCC 62051]|nr:hypothetical protein K438DRAFT_1196123 [Mycena galopus ATCC 62051]
MLQLWRDFFSCLLVLHAHVIRLSPCQAHSHSDKICVADTGDHCGIPQSVHLACKGVDACGPHVTKIGNSSLQMKALAVVAETTLCVLTIWYCVVCVVVPQVPGMPGGPC